MTATTLIATRLAAFLCVVCASPSWWPREHGDAQSTGRAPDQAVGPRLGRLSYTLRLPPASTLPWENAAPAGPLIGTDGTIYAMGVDGTLSAIPAGSSGAVTTWTFQLAAAPVAGMVIDARTHNIFTGDILGNLYALDLASGSVRWRTTLEGSVFATLVVNGPLVIASIEVVGGVAPGGVLVAINVDTGARVWRTPFGNAPSSVAPSLASRAGTAAGCDGTNGCDTVFAVMIDSSTGLYAVIALDAATGVLLWGPAVGTGNAPASEVAVAGGRAFFGGNSGLTALNASTGVELWTVVPSGITSNAGIQSTPVVSRDGGVVFVNEFFAGVFSVSAVTGATLNGCLSGFSQRGGVLDALGVLYYVDFIGEVAAIDTNNMTAIWRYNTLASAPTTLAVVAGRLAVISGEGILFVFDDASPPPTPVNAPSVGLSIGGVVAIVVAALAAAAAAWGATQWSRRRAAKKTVPVEESLLDHQHRSIATSTADLNTPVISEEPGADMLSYSLNAPFLVNASKRASLAVPSSAFVDGEAWTATVAGEEHPAGGSAAMAGADSFHPPSTSTFLDGDSFVLGSTG